MSTTNQFCTFFLGDLLLGVEVLKIQEVIRFQAMTKVPLAPPTVRGLINLRGQIVLAVDLRQRLELPPAAGEAEPMNIVVRDGESAVSLLVDDIGDVLELSADRFEPPPDTLTGVARELVRGVFQLKDRLLLVLDIQQTTTLPLR
ncbi:MAG: chemotaxis protein CheW [Pedosphaera sp. Tous-C6FEB]|nr:MAG: chemotaxis protein CheW [Pedosphaera sp. Tous-C6FEB]